MRSIPWVTLGAMCFYLALAIPYVRGRLSSLLGLEEAPSKHYFPFLNALRGLAALWVASFHTWQWLWRGDIALRGAVEQGFKAVALFFVLSGFLLYRGLARGLPRGGDLARYFKKRALRIYPLFLATVIGFSLLKVHQGTRTTPSAFFAEALLVGLVDPTVLTNPPAWSLYQEIIFYLALPSWVLIARWWPLAAVGTRRSSASRQEQLVAATGHWALALALTAFALATLSSFRSFPVLNTRAFKLPKFFFLGIAAAELSSRKWFASLREWQALALFFAGSVVLGFDLAGTDVCATAIVAVLGWLGVTVSLVTNDYYSVAQAVGFSLVVLAGASSDLLRRIGSWKALQVLGVISYSLFLWHAMVVLIDTPARLTGVEGRMQWPPDFHPAGGLDILVGLYFPAFVTIACLSYLAIERPFLRLAVASSRA
jgi:peptidoglycan/LPS O-acetylase OafA/YrhL